MKNTDTQNNPNWTKWAELIKKIVEWQPPQSIAYKQLYEIGGKIANDKNLNNGDKYVLKRIWSDAIQAVTN